MDYIRIIVDYKDLFDDEPLDINSYLKGLSKDLLLESALVYCSLSTILEPNLKNIFYPFLLNDDIESGFLRNLNTRVQLFISRNKRQPVILNVRSSLKFFEYIQSVDISPIEDISPSEIRVRLLKVYLLFNHLHRVDFRGRENFKELLIGNSIAHSIYLNTNLFSLRVAEIEKSCLFLKFCESELPKHLEVFLKDYRIKKWKEYVQKVHQIGLIAGKRNVENPLTPIVIPSDLRDYDNEVYFFEKFCIDGIYHNDADFSKIKSTPVIKDSNNQYHVIFEQFFVEKMYKGLYFVFREINNSFEGSEDYIAPSKFRSHIGKMFSEKVLLNNIISESIGKKYKHLCYEDLQRNGLPDYYIRDGKYIFIFECKDNLVKKEVVENVDLDAFITELDHLFVKNEKGKNKAIKQLISNVISIRNGSFIEDPGINLRSNVIYPVVITHNTIFSLAGVNLLINDWFLRELDSQNVSKVGIKNITLININTLIVLQDYLSHKEFSLKTLIDSYWEIFFKFSRRSFQTPEEFVSEQYKVSLSFDEYVEFVVDKKRIPMKGILKFYQYFEEK